MNARFLRLTTPLLLLTAALLLSGQPAQASVDLLYFRSESSAASIRLEWATGFELNNLGFFVLRADSDNFDDAVRINPTLIPGTNNVNGSTYEYVDSTPLPDTLYYYWLESIDSSEGSSFDGPIAAALATGTILATPTSQPATATPRPATPTTSPSPTSVPPTATSLPAAATRTPVPSRTPVPATLAPTAIPDPASEADDLSDPTLSPPTAMPTERPTTAPTLSPAPIVAADDPPSDMPPDATELPATAVSLAPPTPTAAQAISAIGAQANTDNSAPDADDLPPPIAEPAPSSRSSLPLVVLVAGLLLSIGGGAATWLFLRRNERE